MLNKDNAVRQFNEFVDTFPATSKSRLKHDHSIRVADICERIAKMLNLSERQSDIAWLAGLLHDLGRFEQLAKYDTFDDSKSMDHALASEQILFNPRNETIWNYTLGINLSSVEKILLQNAIRQHSRAYLSPILSQVWYSPNNFVFHHILRDADKIDILRYSRRNIFTAPDNDTADDFTVGCLKHFCNRTVIPHDEKHTYADKYLGLLSFIYQMNFSESIKILKEYSYVDEIVDEMTNYYNMPGCAKDMLEDYGFDRCITS